ncbi:MAG: class I SAM-dependent methyltransferase [Planctomycetota bacterium]
MTTVVAANEAHAAPPTCPLCKAAVGVTVIEHHVGKSSSGPLEYDIYRCATCGSCHAFPLKAAPDDFYDGYDYPVWRWEFDVLLDFLQRQFPNGARVLEVGCGEGHLMNRMDRTKYEVIGLDSNTDCIKAAQAKGLNCHIGFAGPNHEQLKGKRFDLIFFFHLLEHLDNPAAFLSTMRSMLTDTGMIVLSVPNENRMMLKICTETFDYPPNHLFRYSDNGLKHLYRDCGFEAAETLQQPLDLNLISFLSWSVYALLDRRFGWSRLYDRSAPRSVTILCKAPFFVLLFPVAAVRYLYWKARGKQGLARLFVLKQLNASRHPAAP